MSKLTAVIKYAEATIPTVAAEAAAELALLNKRITQLEADEDKMILELENPTKAILNTIKLKQKDVAEMCAIAIKQGNRVDWKQVNAAIVERWSRSGRERVLTMAWKIVEAQ